MNKWEKNKNIMNTLFNYQHMCTFSDTVIICKVKKQQMGDCGGGGNRRTRSGYLKYYKILNLIW
jgi:hypothetical protein